MHDTETHQRGLLSHRFGVLEAQTVRYRWWQGIPGRPSIGVWYLNLACDQASFHRSWQILDLHICLETSAPNLPSHLESESIPKGCHIPFPAGSPAFCLGIRELGFKLLLESSPYPKKPWEVASSSSSAIWAVTFFRDLALSVPSAGPENSPDPPPRCYSSVCWSTALITLPKLPHP